MEGETKPTERRENVLRAPELERYYGRYIRVGVFFFSSIFPFPLHPAPRPRHPKKPGERIGEEKTESHTHGHRKEIRASPVFRTRRGRHRVPDIHRAELLRQTPPHSFLRPPLALSHVPAPFPVIPLPSFHGTYRKTVGDPSRPRVFGHPPSCQQAVRRSPPSPQRGRRDARENYRPWVQTRSIPGPTVPRQARPTRDRQPRCPGPSLRSRCQVPSLGNPGAEGGTLARFPVPVTIPGERRYGRGGGTRRHGHARG